MFASRASTWPRDHLCRSTIAPRRSRPTTWNAFLPMSMPIVATIEFILLDMAVLLSLVAPSKHHSLEGREHGRTIPLNCGAVCPNVASDKLRADDPRLLLLSKGFWLQSDRSATDARRAGDRKLTRLVSAAVASIVSGVVEVGLVTSTPAFQSQRRI